MRCCAMARSPEPADHMARAMEAMHKQPSDPHFDLGRDKEADKYSTREMQNMLNEQQPMGKIMARTR